MLDDQLFGFYLVDWGWWNDRGYWQVASIVFCWDLPHLNGINDPVQYIYIYAQIYVYVYMYNMYVLYIYYVYHTPTKHIMLDSLSKTVGFLWINTQKFLAIAAHFTDPVSGAWSHLPCEISMVFTGEGWNIHHLAMTNIAMENGPFIDGWPIKNGDFPWLC
jgi:hypothetical protein